MNTIRRSSVALVAVVLVSACGAGGGDSSADPAESPLADLLGWNNNSSPAEDRAKQLAQEEAVATCMRAEGFEYTPVDYEAQYGGVTDEDAALFTDPIAYGEKYGYGVVHNYEQYEEPFLLGEQDEEEFYSDPNSDYMNSLSPSEQEAYNTVLYGDQSFYEQPASTIAVDGEEVSEDVYVSPPLEEQGCYGQAYLEVYGEQVQTNPEIEQRLNDFWQQTQNDPEIEAAEQDWLKCLRDEVGDIESPVEGFEITGPDSMYQYMDFLKSAAMGYEIVDYESDDDGSSGYSSEGEPEAIAPDELETLRARELELWKIDNGCQQDARFTEIRLQIEQRLVDDLTAEFPELAETSG